MPIFGWIRDALGIHKDNVEIDKAELEIRKLEEEEIARRLITPATMDDIKEYDPLYRRVRDTHTSIKQTTKVTRKAPVVRWFSWAFYSCWH